MLSRWKQPTSSVIFVALLLACQPSQQTLDSSTRQASGRPSAARSTSDLTVDLTLASPWTRAKDIAVTWAPVEGATEYKLDIAADEDCTNILQSLRTKNSSTNISELAEGSYFLCLQWTLAGKVSGANAKGLQLIVDRQPPKITAALMQTLALGESPKLEVTDGIDVACTWSTSSETLTITGADTLSPKLSCLNAGTYLLQLACDDKAGNHSEESFSFTLPADPNAKAPVIVAEPEPTPTPTEAPQPPTVSAGLDLLRAGIFTLTGTSKNAQTFAWTQVSGPGTITFGNAASIQTAVTASADGVYVLRLKATAASGLSAEDDMTLTYDTTPPTADAGQDVTIGTPTTLVGVPGLDATSVGWRKISGPGNLSFSSSGIVNPVVSASLDGTYVIEFRAVDAAGNAGIDQMQFRWVTNAPTVNVGPDLNTRVAVSLAPTVSGATSYAWSKISGTGTLTFGTPSAKNTTVSASADGTYVISLTVSDAAGVTATDTLTLVWDTVAPTVNAGLDRSANAAITQTGTSTGGATYAWTQVAGTGTVTFGSANALITTLAASADGNYTLRLTATDAAGNSASDDMILSWDSTAPNNVTGLAATPGVKAMTLAWTDGGGGTQSYLVLRSTATITDAPTKGVSYTVGTAIGSTTVVAASSTAGFADSGLTGNATYYYKVFTTDAIGNWNSGVQVSGVAQPLKTLKATLTKAGFYTTTKITGIQAYGSTAYVCRDDAGLAIVNASNPALPTLTGSVTLGNNAAAGWCSDVKVSGTIAYVADWDKGLVTVDISNPAAPVVKGTLAMTNASIVTIDGNYAYVAVEDDTTGGGLAIVNISNPAAPTLSSFTETDGNASSVVKVGNYVYLSHRDTGNFIGIKVFNVTNPAAPTVALSLVRDNVEELNVAGSYIYAAVGIKGIEIFDVTNPASPVSKAVKPLPDNGYVMSVNVSDNAAFAANNDTNKLYVFDVSNKSSPTSVRTYTTSQAATQPPMFVHVSGAYAYVSIYQKGMEIIEAFTLQ